MSDDKDSDVEFESEDELFDEEKGRKVEYVCAVTGCGKRTK